VWHGIGKGSGLIFSRSCENGSDPIYP
jgi:hypothetical protein